MPLNHKINLNTCTIPSTQRTIIVIHFSQPDNAAASPPQYIFPLSPLPTSSFTGAGAAGHGPAGNLHRLVMTCPQISQGAYMSDTSRLGDQKLSWVSPGQSRSFQGLGRSGPAQTRVSASTVTSRGRCPGISLRLRAALDRTRQG